MRRSSKAEAERDTVPFWPYFVLKDLYALAVVLAVFFAIVGFMPNYLGHPDNYIPANPLATPSHIVPEWYFLPFYAILRAFTGDVWVVMFADWITFGIVDAKFFGVLAMFGAILVMALAPWLDTSLRALGPLPADVQVVVRAPRRRLHRPDVGAAPMPAEGLYPDIALIGADLLVRLLPGDPAAPRRHREAASRRRRRSRPTSRPTTTPTTGGTKQFAGSPAE